MSKLHDDMAHSVIEKLRQFDGKAIPAELLATFLAISFQGFELSIVQALRDGAKDMSEDSDADSELQTVAKTAYLWLDVVATGLQERWEQQKFEPPQTQH